jgi:hypothetical protein
MPIAPAPRLFNPGDYNSRYTLCCGDQLNSSLTACTRDYLNKKVCVGQTGVTFKNIRIRNEDGMSACDTVGYVLNDSRNANVNWFTATLNDVELPAYCLQWGVSSPKGSTGTSGDQGSVMGGFESDPEVQCAIMFALANGYGIGTDSADWTRKINNWIRDHTDCLKYTFGQRVSPPSPDLRGPYNWDDPVAGITNNDIRVITATSMWTLQYALKNIWQAGDAACDPRGIPFPYGEGHTLFIDRCGTADKCKPFGNKVSPDETKLENVNKAYIAFMYMAMCWANASGGSCLRDCSSFSWQERYVPPPTLYNVEAPCFCPPTTSDPPPQPPAPQPEMDHSALSECREGYTVQVCGTTQTSMTKWYDSPRTVRIVSGLVVIGPFRYGPNAPGGCDGVTDDDDPVGDGTSPDVTVEPICDCGEFTYTFTDINGEPVTPQPCKSFYVRIRVTGRFQCFRICVRSFGSHIEDCIWLVNVNGHQNVGTRYAYTARDGALDGEGACMCVCISLKEPPVPDMPEAPPIMVYPRMPPPILPPIVDCINLPPTVVPPPYPEYPEDIRLPAPVLVAPQEQSPSYSYEEPMPVILPQTPVPPPPRPHVRHTPVLESMYRPPRKRYPQVQPPPIVVTPPPRVPKRPPPPQNPPMLRPLNPDGSPYEYPRPQVPPMPTNTTVYAYPLREGCTPVPPRAVPIPGLDRGSRAFPVPPPPPTLVPPKLERPCEGVQCPPPARFPPVNS